MVSLFVDDRTRVMTKGYARGAGDTTMQFDACVASPGSLLNVKVVVDTVREQITLTAETLTGKYSTHVDFDSPEGLKFLELYTDDPMANNPSKEEFLAHVAPNKMQAKQKAKSEV